MKKKFVNVLLVAALLSAAGASVVSCKDNDADIRTELKGEFNEQIKQQFKDFTEMLEAQKKELQNSIDDLQAELDACKAKCGNDYAELNGKITGLSGRIDALEASIKACKDEITRIDGVISSINEKLAGLDHMLDGYATEEFVRDYVRDMLEQIPEIDLSGYASQNWVEEQLNKLREELGGTADGLTEEEVQELIRQYVDGKFLTKADLAAELEARGYLTKDALNNYVTKDALQDELSVFLKSNELEDKVKALLDKWEYLTDEDLQKELTTLRGEVGQLLQEEITGVNNRIDALKLLVKNVLVSMITSIEINATENPIFGGAALPADVRTTVLAAYYGKSAVDFSFPSEDILKKAGVGTPVGFDASQTLFNAEEGNAGTLYLTINPNTVEFEGQTVDLVTSQDMKSPITLSELKRSDKELSFGYSRAANNGFYEAAATLNEEDIQNVKANIDLNNLKTSVQDVLKERNKTSIAKLAATLFSESSDILPAYAVKASYVNDLDAKDPTTVSVLSQYALAATAVKPLSYDFMKDARYNIPFIERIENIIGRDIDKLFKEVTNIIPDLSNLKDVQIGEIKLSESTKEELRYVDLTILIPVEAVTDGVKEGDEIKNAEGKVVGWVKHIKFEDGKCRLTETIDMSETFEKVIADLGENFNVEELQSVLDDLSGLSNIGSDINDLRDKIKNKLFSYIDRLNNRFGNLIGNINTSLQPCLLFLDSDNNVAGRVTTSPTGTQVKGSEITLVPTSYTAELFAPAFKKFVAVTAINGSTAGCADFNNANGLGEVKAGTWTELTLKDLKPNTTYEITYSAVDYSGISRNKVCYISVK